MRVYEVDINLINPHKPSSTNKKEHLESFMDDFELLKLELLVGY